MIRENVKNLAKTSSPLQFFLTVTNMGILHFQSGKSGCLLKEKNSPLTSSDYKKRSSLQFCGKNYKIVDRIRVKIFF